MRTLALAALTMVTVFGATAADAQRLGGHAGAPYPVPGYPGSNYPGQSYPISGNPQPMPRPPVVIQQARNQSSGTRWGGSVGGRWSGGTYAPGGWNAYRRPSRGFALPSYWFASNFYVGDYAGYGLSAPPQGYRWQRYYDDAVLIDSHGRVRDSVEGLDWDGGGYGGGYAGAGGYASSDYGYAYAQGGAGGAGGYSQQQQYAPQYAPLPPVSQEGNVTTYSTSGGYSAQGSYAAGGYSYPGSTTTVVTIQGAPTVTTTTTEYIEETTRARYVVPRRVYRAPVRYYRPARATCSCTRPVRVIRRVVRAPVEQPILGS